MDWQLSLKCIQMKKIFTLSILVTLLAFTFAGCGKNGYYYDDESYWLSQERGQVVYSSSSCNYYVVETNYGYTIIRSFSYFKPYERSIIYGDFSRPGTRDFYDRSSGNVFTGTVTDYWLNYYDAQMALDYYCPYGKGVRQFVNTDSTKMK
jgi:hypothetical protein